jgi:hypothetical protein
MTTALTTALDEPRPATHAELKPEAEPEPAGVSAAEALILAEFKMFND